MLSMRPLFRFVLLLVCVLIAPASASAQKADDRFARGEAFAAPNFREMALTSMMLDAFDNSKNETVDEYAKLMYCPLYLSKFKSDFEWNSIRQELSRKLKSRNEYFRTNYELSGTIFLGRYSFETQDFPFIKNTALVNVGSVNLFMPNRREMNQSRRICGEGEASAMFPVNYVFLLNQPLTLDRIRMPPDEAESLLKRLDQMNNKERALYIRFRVRTMGVSGIDRRTANTVLMFRGDLVSVDIFYDREMTKHFATVALK